MSHRRVRITFSITAVLVFLAPASVTYAVWSNSAQGTVAVTMAARPDLTTCTSRKTPNPGSVSFATVSWTSVDGFTYEVLKRGTTTVVSGITSGTEFSQGTLANNTQLVVRGTKNGGSLTSTKYFDINFSSPGCQVRSP